MSGEIYMAAAGALAAERRLELLANNLANVNTAGFKRDVGQFKYVASPEAPGVSDPAAASLEALAAQVFWMEFRSRTDFATGPLQRTGNPLDLAISGQGFFSVQTAEGVRYTRSGAFTLRADGVLSTRNGDPVLGQGGEIRIPADAAAGEVSIDETGQVTVGGTRLGRLRVVDFADRDQLVKVGDTLFEAPGEAAADSEPASYSVNQGFVEQSNVEPVRMMTEMIEVLRGYEAYQKIIQSIDRINQTAIREVTG